MPDRRVFLVIHGHFYQPPRENPWTGRIGKEFGADPYRNWNEKIARQCYTPNAFSRMLDPDGYVTDIVNNYRYLNFNFGPTLLNWICQYLPETYERIVEGDSLSMADNSGAGNAIAQVYNHIIMPLASERDRRTQIEWGLADFEKHFARKPESMWLAETAINLETAELLMEYGMKYVILSPYQAQSFRPLDSDDVAEDISSGSIDTTRPYRLFSRDRKKQLDVFFYDGGLSSAVSFEHLATDSGRFCSKILESVADKKGDVLVNISTDGELYGHHEPFADMCLAYLFKAEAQQQGITVTNYSAYLRDHEPKHEVFLRAGEDAKGTSWSCFHGVARWERDCGCTTGSRDGWNQSWRTPLRTGLNVLRDKLVSIFEKEGKKYFKDVWAARNDYIRVIYERTQDNRNEFLQRHLRVPLTKLKPEDRLKIFSLLESQHCAQLMFTSCGWFFAEISGIEPVQLMKYASMALSYIKDAFGTDLEPLFLAELEKARSNIRGFGSGKDIYLRKAVSSAMTVKQAAANYIMQSYITKDTSDRAVFDWFCRKVMSVRKTFANVTVVKGRLSCLDTRSEKEDSLEYMLFVYSYRDFRLFVYPFEGSRDFVREIRRADEEHLQSDGSAQFFSLKDIVLEDKDEIIHAALDRRLDSLSESIQKIYERNTEFLEGFHEIGLEVPEIVKTVASYVMSDKINRALPRISDPFSLDSYKELRKLFAYAQKYGLDVEKTAAAALFDRTIESGIVNADKERDTVLLSTLAYILDIADEIGVEIRLDLFQNMVFRMIISYCARYETEPERYGVDGQFKFYVKALNRLAERLNIHKQLPF